MAFTLDVVRRQCPQSRPHHANLSTALHHHGRSSDRQINLTLPPDFPVGVVDIVVRSVDVPEPADGTAEQRQRSDLRSLFEFLDTLPPTGRSSEEIDRQVQEERDSWEQ